MSSYSDEKIKAEGELCEISFVDADKVRRARKAVPESELLLARAEWFRLLGDPTRLRILYALAAEELCVCDLASLLYTSPSAVSHQLRLLRAAGLVRYRKAGKMVYYAFDHPQIRALLNGAGGRP